MTKYCYKAIIKLIKFVRVYSMKFKRIISAVLSSVLGLSLGVTGLCAGEYAQPFEKGTGSSELFRIPSIITLKSGRLLVAADARYGNGSDSPANIDTVVRYSDNNGQTWSDASLINHFTDVEDSDDVTRVTSSASFIDSAAVEDSQGKIYIITDALPAFMGNTYAGKSGSGLIDGRLVLCDKTTEDGIESTELDKKHYPYYIDESDGGYAPVRAFSDNSIYKNYYVDREFNLFTLDGGKYRPVMIPVIGGDGKITEKTTQANVFYALSPVKLYPTFYTWLRISTDGGETWSSPVILNRFINSRGFTGVGPGRGFTAEVNGRERVMFTVYDNNDRTEYTSVIYTDDSGATWSRTEKCKKVGLAGKSSESQIVELNDGTLRMFSRNTAKHISFCDSTDGGLTWSRYKLDFSLKYCSNCMVSFINYSGLIDGKKAIIAAYPSAGKRKLGVVRIGLVEENNKIDWEYSYNVTDSIEDITYIYSCLTELDDGRIALLYENRAAEITYSVFDIDELTVHDKRINLFRRIIIFIKSLFARG